MVELTGARKTVRQCSPPYAYNAFKAITDNQSILMKTFHLFDMNLWKVMKNNNNIPYLHRWRIASWFEFTVFVWVCAFCCSSFSIIYRLKSGFIICFRWWLAAWVLTDWTNDDEKKLKTIFWRQNAVYSNDVWNRINWSVLHT